MFNEAEIKAQAAAQGVGIGKGDIVLFHTGWLNLAGVDNERFMAGEPGLGVGGARYLAGLRCRRRRRGHLGPRSRAARGSDAHVPGPPRTVGEETASTSWRTWTCGALAADEGWEFLFVLGQPRFEGAVQAVINPVAIR